MADDRHFEDGYIVIFQWNIVQVWRNFVGYAVADRDNNELISPKQQKIKSDILGRRPYRKLKL